MSPFAVTLARILIICLAACTLPSLGAFGAFPTDKVAGPSQENAALDLLADAEVVDSAHAKFGTRSEANTFDQPEDELAASRTAVAKPCEIRPCPEVCKTKTKRTGFGLRHRVTACGPEQLCKELNDRCAKSIEDQEKQASADLKKDLLPWHTTKGKPDAEDAAKPAISRNIRISRKIKVAATGVGESSSGADEPGMTFGGADEPGMTFGGADEPGMTSNVSKLSTVLWCLAGRNPHRCGLQGGSRVFEGQAASSGGAIAEFPWGRERDQHRG